MRTEPQNVNADLDLPVRVETTQGEIIELCKCLDMAVRARGNEAAQVVGFWLVKLQAACDEAAIAADAADMSRKPEGKVMPMKRQDVEAESDHGAA